jgi:hypothetical protein
LILIGCIGAAPNIAVLDAVEYVSSSRLTDGMAPSRPAKSGAETHRPKRIAKVTSKAGIETNPSQTSGELFQTVTRRAFLMTLSWDTRCSSFDADVGLARLYNATVAPRRYQVCCHDAKPRFAIHQTKLHRIKPTKNLPQIIGFVESVY